MKSYCMSVFSLLTFACGGDDTNSAPLPPPPDAAIVHDAASFDSPSLDDGETVLTDGQIVFVLHTINQGEIQEADLAAKSATKPEVIAFANRMSMEHAAADATLLDTAKTAKISQGDSGLSNSLDATVTSQMATLQGDMGAAFDSDYISYQVTDHQTALATIDTMLLPVVTDASVRQQIQAARTMVVMHLSQAQALQGDGGM